MKKILNITALSVGVMLYGQTQIIAHRGFWNTDPKTAKNSIASLENAQKIKVYGSEFDVQMTKDGVLVVNHDEHINNVEIAETTYSELKSQKLSNGETIPTLESYLSTGKKDSSVKLIVELKPLKSEFRETEMVGKALQMIKGLKLENQVDYISFSLHICKELKKQDATVKVQYLKGELSPAEIKNLGIDGIDYHYSVFLEKHKDWLAQAKQLGLITNAWTVNDPAIYQQLKDLGVDFVTTDIPDQLLKK